MHYTMCLLSFVSMSVFFKKKEVSTQCPNILAVSPAVNHTGINDVLYRPRRVRDQPSGEEMLPKLQTRTKGNPFPGSSDLAPSLFILSSCHPTFFHFHHTKEPKNKCPRFPEQE